MGFKFECHCDWCKDVVTLEANQAVIDLSESVPEGWMQQVDDATRTRLTLCGLCKAARQRALQEAEGVKITLVAEAKRARTAHRRMKDEDFRKLERQRMADGH